MKNKIGIFYDSLTGYGGASNVAVELANGLNADLITSGYNTIFDKELKKNIQVINIGNLSSKFNKSISYFFEVPLRFLFYKKTNYDINIFLGTSSIFCSRKNEKNVWYCFTPNRFLYDLKEWKLKNSGFFKKIIFLLHILLFNKLDQKIIRNNFEIIIAQSKIIQKRIQNYYQRKSEIIFSPVDVSKYYFERFDNFYLAVSRLMPEKRMDLIAKIFTKINKPLIMVGNGPEKLKIQNIIKKNKNIQLLDKVDNNELKRLYATCLALIYLPKDEDYGLVPLEGMASGKTCIAANEGGCKETIIDKKTGFLVDVSEASIINLIEHIDKKLVISMKKACIKRSKEFDTKLALSKFNRFIYT